MDSKIIQALLEKYMQASAGTGGGAAPGGMAVAPPLSGAVGGGDPSGFAPGNMTPQGTGGGDPGEYSLSDQRLEQIRRPRR